MAVHKFNSEEKSHAYAVLARINHSFRNIVSNLYDLEKSGAFDLTVLNTFRGLAKEMQAQLNMKLLSALLPIEERHAFEFGKVRIAREHFLNPERPSFKKRR